MTAMSLTCLFQLMGKQRHVCFGDKNTQWLRGRNKEVKESEMELFLVKSGDFPTMFQSPLLHA